MCASTGILCAGCEAKLRKGRITELDSIVSNILFHDNVKGYDHLVNSETTLFIFASKDDVPKIIGYGGKTVKELFRKVGKKVVVLESGGDMETVINSIVKPNKLASINRIYKPDGKEILKLVFVKPIKDETVVQLVKDVVGKEIEIAN
jgi:transcription antitermination factor NusA-like protein